MKSAAKLVDGAQAWADQEEEDMQAAATALWPFYNMDPLTEKGVSELLRLWQDVHEHVALLPLAYRWLSEIDSEAQKQIKLDKILTNVKLMLAKAELVGIHKDITIRVISPLEGLRRALEKRDSCPPVKTDLNESMWDTALGDLDSPLAATIEKEEAKVDLARKLMTRRSSSMHPTMRMAASSATQSNPAPAAQSTATAGTQQAAAGAGGGQGAAGGAGQGAPTGGGAGGGGGGPGGGPWCPICFKSGHTADSCPDRPRDGKGPICALCHRRGHMFWACPTGPGAPECPTCLLKGHAKEDCPLAKVIQKRQAARAPAHQDEERLKLKLGLTPSDLESSDSEGPPPPEDPRKAMRRQLKEKRRMELSKRLEKAAKEEGRQRMRRWAEFPKIQEDIMYLVADDPLKDPAALTPDQQKTYSAAILQAYVQSLARPSKGLDAGGMVGTSLKELGIDNITLFTGEEGKYAVKPFLLKVEDIKSYKGWSDSVAAVALGQLLAGTAKDWYENQKRDRMGEAYEYTELRDDLLKEFFQKITLVEKTQIMASLRFDLTKHKSHMAFLVECERKSHVLQDSGFFLSDQDQLITRRAAREEGMLMYFLAGASPQVRFQVEYAKAETKEQIKAEIRKFEDALRAKSANTKLIEPGYQVSEVSNEVLSEQLQGHGYDQMYINAVMKGRGGKSGSRTAKVAAADALKPEVKCWYCAKEGHVKNECFSLKEDDRKGTVHPDRLGPKEGQEVAVETLSKGKGRTKPTAATGARPKTKVRTRRTKKVNEVEYDDEAGAEASGEEELQPLAASKKTRLLNQWAPWPQGGYPMMMPYPAPTSRGAAPEGQADVAEVSGARVGAWDLL